MQKFLFPLLVLLIGFSLPTMAQNDDFKSNVALSYNYTFTGSLLNAAIDAAEELDGNVTKSSLPSFQVSYDYSIKQYLSVGVAVSYQDIGLKVAENQFIDEMGVSQTEDFKASFSRFCVAFRPLFHYGNSDRLDMYSGLRIQFFQATFTEDSNDPSVDQDFLGFEDVNKIGVGITPFGIRYFLTENIGLGWELNIGRPYVTSLSVNARF